MSRVYWAAIRHVCIGLHVVQRSAVSADIAIRLIGQGQVYISGASFKPNRMPLEMIQLLIVVVSQFNSFNPLSPHNALKHHITSLKTDLIS